MRTNNSDTHRGRLMGNIRILIMLVAAVFSAAAGIVLIEHEEVVRWLFPEPQTGYTLDGTIVGVTTDSTHSTSTFNLTLSRPTLKVTSITGTLTNVNSVMTGSLSFNGDPYTYAELNAP